MTIAKEDIPLIKPWLVKRSSEVSDADPEVLADYIIALLNNKVEGDELISLLKSELEDFSEKNEEFAVEINEALTKRSFIQGDAEAKKLLDPEEHKKLVQKQAIELTTSVYKLDRTSYRNAPPDYRRKINKFNPKLAQFNKPIAPPGLAEIQEQRRKEQEHLKELVDPNSTNGKGRYIVVSNLPADKLEDDILRSYFSRFGELETIKINHTTRIAELEFKTVQSAKKAWSSPVPIFDNRFIKVFFKKPNDGNGDDEEMVEATKETPFDVEAFKLQQIEKQKQFELKQEQRRAFNAKLQQLIELKEKMLSGFEKQLQELENKLREQPELEPEIKIKLEDIQKEMTINGVTPEAIAQDKAKLAGKPSYPISSRGRGVIRGRGGRGRYSTTPYQRPPASRSLDLRTRTITVKGLTNSEDEAFKAALKEAAGEDGVSSIEAKDADLNITFKSRYAAEKFIKAEVRLSDGAEPIAKEWDESVRPSTTLTSSSTSPTDEQNGSVPESEDVDVGL